MIKVHTYKIFTHTHKREIEKKNVYEQKKKKPNKTTEEDQINEINRTNVMS